jgi:hypothetical protein
MNLFGIELYKKRYKKPLRDNMKKAFALGMKSLIMLLIPIIPTLLAVGFWYFVVFQNQLCFNEKMENIIVAACIPTFGLLYCLLVAVVFNTVWTEYKSIRLAVKRYDIETFVDLMDEEISPLVYILIGIRSLSILGSFMLLKFPEVKWGAIIISSTAYVLFLVFFVIREMDDPCSGVWFIKNLHSEWLTIDVRKWRAERCEESRKKLEDMIKKFTRD